MADLDKELLELGAVPNDDELEAMGAISPDQQKALVDYVSTPGVSELESLRAGLAEGGTFGFAPRIGAAVTAPLQYAQQRLSGDPEPQSLADLYNEYIAANKKRDEIARQANPVSYHAAEFAGALASPINKLATVGTLGHAAKNASVLSKMGHGIAAGAKLGAIQGLSQSDDLTDVKKDLDSLGKGAAIGMGVGAAIPPAAAGIGATAKGVASLFKSAFGPVAETFQKGMQAGATNAPNLATEAGQHMAHEQGGKWATKFVKNLQDVINTSAQDKAQTIKNATRHLSPEDVDSVLQKYLDENPHLNTEESYRQLEQLKEMILMAREGRLKDETVRIYGEMAPPRPLPSNEKPWRPGHVDEVMPPEEGPAPAAPGGPDHKDVTPVPVAELQAPPVQPEPPPASMVTMEEPPLTPVAAAEEPFSEQVTKMSAESDIPVGFSGYEAIHKATIDAGDAEARAAFEQKVKEKLLDEQILGKNANANDIRIEEHQIPGTDKVRLVAKRALHEEDAEAFKDQAEALAKRQKEEARQKLLKEKEEARQELLKQKEAARLRALLEKQQEEQIKAQQKLDAERLKPQFQDVKQRVRSNDRNIYDPRQLYDLQQKLQEHSLFSEGKGFSEDEIAKRAGRAAQDISGLLKTHLGTETVDETLHAFNNIAESVGIDPRTLNLTSGEGAKARTDAFSKILQAVSPENLDDRTLVNQEKLKYIAEQLRIISPEMADDFAAQAAKQREIKGLVKEFSEPYEPSGLNLLFNVIRRNASKLSYQTGYSAGQQGQKMSREFSPLIEGVNKTKQAATNTFQKYTPDYLKALSAKMSLTGSQTAKGLSQVLLKAAESDAQSRGAIIYMLLQNPAYRQELNKYTDEDKAK